MFYQLADYFFTILHLIIILFNLLGWIWKPLQKLHLVVVGLTLACWFILGIWYGIGYCPITDWQWQVKEKLGETNLSGSFIKYFADKLTGQNFNADLIDLLTGCGFIFASLITVYVNFIRKKSLKPGSLPGNY